MPRKFSRNLSPAKIKENKVLSAISISVWCINCFYLAIFLHELPRSINQSKWRIGRPMPGPFPAPPPNPRKSALERRLSAQGESRLADELCKVWFQKPSVKGRLAKGVQRNFLKAWITTDSIKIFSITFCTLVTVYCTCKIAKDAFRIVFYVTTFYVPHCVQHCAVARFVLKQWFFYNCTYVAEMYNVVCYWKTVSLYCELIN